MMENDNAPDSIITDEERDFLQGYLEHLLFSVEPAFPLTVETIKELLERLLANRPAWEADERWG